MPPTYTQEYGLLTATTNLQSPDPADWDAFSQWEAVARSLGELLGEGFFSPTHFNVQPIAGQPQAEMLNVDVAQSSSYGIAGTPGNRKIVFQNGSKTITAANGIVMGTSMVLKTNYFWVKKVVGHLSSLEPDIVVTQTNSVPSGCMPFPCATMDFNDVEGIAYNNNPTGRVNLLPFGLPSAINDQTGTAYSILIADMGKLIALSNAAAITLTVPAGLGKGFRCRVYQKGAGQVTFSPGGGVTIRNRAGQTKTNAQYAKCELEAIAVNEFVLSGDTGP